MKVLFALAVATMVGVTVWFGLALYTWTVIHSGWSELGIQMFAFATWVVPVAVGIGAGWAAYRA
jgi:hypothetical protein